MRYKNHKYGRFYTSNWKQWVRYDKRCMYYDWTYISGYGGAFHSTLYKLNDRGARKYVYDKRLGVDASAGCIRLPDYYAAWIRKNILPGTAVIIQP